MADGVSLLRAESSPPVALIGQAERAEMRSIAAWLETHAAASSLRKYPTVEAFATSDRAGWIAELVVVLESHPDEYSARDIDALFSAAPTSRIVCCAGAWSESAGRTRKFWTLALRVPAAAAIARLEREWALLHHQPASTFLPPTGSREEWFAAHHPALAATEPASSTSIRVASPDSAYRQMLADLLAAAGFLVVPPDRDDASVILWDADPWSADRLAEIRRLTAAGPVLALTGWITPELEAELSRAGVQAVLPKLGDIQRVIDCLARQ